jgi:hypothetical protein
MSSEPLTTSPAAETTAIASTERGLLIAVLMLVVLGATAMILMV